jgi:hypothetical protein
MFVGVAALGVLVAACGGSGAIVATVNGVDVTASDVEALYSSDLGAVPATQFAENLRNTIVEFVVIQEAETQYGITFTPDEIEAKRAELEEQVVAQSGGSSYEEFLEENGSPISNSWPKPSKCNWSRRQARSPTRSFSSATTPPSSISPRRV